MYFSFDFSWYSVHFDSLLRTGGVGWGGGGSGGRGA